MVLPCRSRDVHARGREPTLMRQHLQQGDVTLAVSSKFGNVIGNRIVEGERSLLDQHPHCRRRHDLGVGIKEPQRVVLGWHWRGLETSLAEAAEKRELPMAGERDLCPGI